MSLNTCALLQLSGAEPAPALTKVFIRLHDPALKHYIAEIVHNDHLLGELGKEFTVDALQRLLQKEGFGPQAKNVKELGAALQSAGVTEVRKTVNGVRSRLRRLPETETMMAWTQIERQF